MRIFPRPVSPRSALADLKLMFSPDRPHRWSLLALSATLTGILIWAFLHDSRIPEQERQIIYVESWMNDRKDSDIIRQQLVDIDTYETALSKKQKEFQHVADMVGIEWREDAARNDAQRKAVVAAVKKQLNERLEKALEREAAEPATANAGPAGPPGS